MILSSYKIKKIHNLKNLVIPEGVTELEEHLFKGCREIETVSLPSTLKRLSASVFAFCTNLKEINLENIEVFGTKCLLATSITNVELQNARVIGQQAFCNCGALKSIRLPEEVEMHYGAFAGCKGLSGELEIPEGVEEIPENAFVNAGVSKLKLPKSLRKVGPAAFMDCHKLSLIEGGENVTLINQGAFSGCLPTVMNQISRWPITGYGLNVFDDEDKIPKGEFIPRTSEKAQLPEELIPMAETHWISKNWAETMTQFLKLGIHPFVSSKWIEPTTEEITFLSELFKKKFGRAPKVVADIATAIKVLNLLAEEIVETFSVKGFKEALRMSNNCPFVAIVALLGIEGDRNLLNKFGIKTSFELGVAASSVRHWIFNNPTKLRLLPQLKNIGHLIDEETSCEEVNYLLYEDFAFGEINKIQRSWSPFDFDKVQCSISRTSVEVAGLSAYILESTDLRQVTVGYDTYCCQHFGGAGETAMMYGLMSSTAGFWVIEDRKGEIKAQAEVWLSEDGQTFVFDNIEFANDREVSDYEEIIKAWVEATPYPNVILGMGYTELSLPCPETAAPPQPQVEELWDVYTDTYRSLLLKKDGELTW